LVIRLDSGSLSAEVVPVNRPESFVVEVAATRVAVHGTRFHVERRSSRVFVDVSEGAVAVAPLMGSDKRWLLRAPSSGDFALDGSSGHVVTSEPIKSTARLASHAGSAVKPGPSAAAGDAASQELTAPDEAVDAAPAPLPDKPSIGELEAGLSLVIDRVSRCFTKHMPARGDMRVTARTTLKLKVAPDGSIAEQSFEPPLSPTVSACGALEAEQVRFVASREGVSVTRILELNR
jgi:hypothetical protein